MAHFNANYEVISLSGTQTTATLGNGITASSVHQVYCLAPGNITITPLQGASFVFSSTTANVFINVIVSATTVNAGTFIGFRSKFSPVQFF